MSTMVIGRMRPVVISLLIGLPLGIYAQTQFPGFQYRVSSAPDQYGVYSVKIENRSKISITAVHAFSSCEGMPGTDQSSGEIGSDSLMQFSFLRPASIAIQGPSIIRPGQNLQMDLPVSDVSCPKGVSVLFEDGHGEGNDDATYGWHHMIADRFSICNELQRTRKLVEGFDATMPNYSSALLNALAERRSMLADKNLRDVPRSEVSSRSKVLEALLVRLRVPEQTPAELKSRDATLTLLDTWMTPLKSKGYDKPAVSTTPSEMD